MSTACTAALIAADGRRRLPALGASDLPPARRPRIRLPFTATLSSNTPLAFGMDAQDSRARARVRRSIISAAARATKSSSRSATPAAADCSTARHRLYLQFRNGRLAGWKGDWGHNWMWQ